MPPWSLSARRAWIEIKTGKTHRIYLPSLSARRAWIEIRRASGAADIDNGSLSARRAWIEIVMPFFAISGAQVALRKESVDRNPDVEWTPSGQCKVALRKESVDRNP